MKETVDWNVCEPAYFGLVQEGEIEDEGPTYVLRCAGCDECVPWSTFASEEEWQEFREAVKR